MNPLGQQVPSPQQTAFSCAQQPTPYKDKQHVCFPGHEDPSLHRVANVKEIKNDNKLKKRKSFRSILLFFVCEF